MTNQCGCKSCLGKGQVAASNSWGELSTASPTSQPTANSTDLNLDPENFISSLKKPNPIGHGRPRKQAPPPIAIPNPGSAMLDDQITPIAPSPSQSSQSGSSLLSDTPTPLPKATTGEFCFYEHKPGDPPCEECSFYRLGNQSKLGCTIDTGPLSASLRPQAKPPIQQDSLIALPGSPPLVRREEPDSDAWSPNNIQQDMTYVPPPTSTSMLDLRVVKLKQDEAIGALMSRSQLENSLVSGATCLDTLRHQRRIEEEEQVRQLRYKPTEEMSSQSNRHKAERNDLEDKFYRGYATIDDVVALKKLNRLQFADSENLYGQLGRTYNA
ncbi:hypothetical protein IFR05_008443 [Cadophora sp. M221]|nr:hypothetical protein IFR05_008443 [Cadophora sp. M221]